MSLTSMRVSGDAGRSAFLAPICLAQFVVHGAVRTRSMQAAVLICMLKVQAR